ncbi:MYCBP-associated protein-like [Achroia grisella]|uniref:MYCBP-associated protein-like n=1 Tax=Achroia grisella TaxID=688607 RepID=UPI0027D2D499|nr:MYCBP-associated protein-like [Achroia grisella]
MILFTLPHTLPIITAIVNESILKGIVPNQWKIALITPISKVTQPNDLKDLRPINILPFLSKILEKAVNEQLLEYVEASNILPSLQSGFRRGRGTITALLDVTDNLLIEQDGGRGSLLTLLDFSRAFESLNIPLNPNHELVVWEKWIKIRKEETARLGERTNRPPIDLTMNLLEKVREDKERKIVLEHAQIEKKATVRDTLWEQPVRLKQKCYCKPAYEVHRTPAEMGYPTVIEHVGVPEYIKRNEKGLTGVPKRKPCNQLNTNYEKFRQKRENELTGKIQEIDPFRPDMRKLIIKGSKPILPPRKMPPIPTISVTPSIPMEYTTCGICAIRINNTVIFKDNRDQNLKNIKKMQKESWHESCTSWTYYFKVPLKRAGRSKLLLENLGTVTLRYCWKKIKQSIPFAPEDNNTQVFFFNKNEDVLSPGQSKYLYFTFISEKAGIYSEFWELSFCNICFFDTLADKLIINLQGDSVENMDNIKRKIEVLKNKLNKKAINNIVKSLLEGIVHKSTITDPQIYPYKKMLLEAEIFHMKNPICFYHQTEVTKMKDVYTEMVPGELWDLSISNWRQAMMEKEYDERMKFYELLRKSHAELLKPWYEGEDLLTYKYRATKMLLGKMADSFDVSYMRIIDVTNHTSEITKQPDLAKSDHRLVSLSTEPLIQNTIRNLFYLRAYEHVAVTIESIVGILSSLELNKWIDFDFCR